MKTDIFDTIKQWHVDTNRSTLERQFALGDLLISAIVRSGLDDKGVISRVMEDADQYSMSLTYYVVSIHICRIYTSNQRAVLLDKQVPGKKVEILATGEYDSRRANIVARIKRGECVYPFDLIERAIDKKKRKFIDHDTLKEPSCDEVVIRIKDRGEISPDVMLDGLRSLVSQVPQNVLVAMLNTAINLCRKSGLQLRNVEIQ